MRFSTSPLAITIAALIALSPAFPQTVGGTILGAVRDPQGAAVVDAKATIVNSATGVSRALLTNQDGLYRAPNLQPGAYVLTVQAPGFAAAVKRDVALNVGAELVVDFELRLGNLSETVEVKAQEPGVDLATTTVSHNVGGTTIRELPLNGRDWTQLATLQPGISAIGAGGGASRGGSGVKLTVSGARPTENNFRLDGVSLNDNSNSTPGNVLGTNLGVEAVREFSVVSNSYSAEYGRATGGVINAVTRSGANQVHGTVFYFHRNSALDARNFFDGSVKPAFRRHQFGAAAGGPIKKNRTFWFMDYEAVREFLATTSIANTLSANARIGRLSTGAIPVDPAVAKLFPLLPLPNAGLLGGGDTGQYLAPIDKVSQGKYVLGKIDHRLSDADSLSGSYIFEGATANAPDPFYTKSSTDRTRRQTGILEYTRTVSPSILNVARVAFARSASGSGVVTAVYNQLLNDPALGFLPGFTLGSVLVPGIIVPGGGPGASNASINIFNSFQFHENVYITKGTHSIKAGGSLERMQFNLDTPNRNGGEFSFGSISDFLTNRPSTFGALYPGSDSHRGLRQTMLAGYIQDDIRWRKNLTLNMGVRYEFLTGPGEVNGKIALLHGLTDPAVKVGGPVWDNNPTRRNFAPRVGLVWDPFNSGKTSIRAGMGVFDSLPLLWLFDTPLTRSTPFFLQGVTATPAVGSYPNKAYTGLTVQSLRTVYVDPSPGRAYSLKWNLNIQRQFGNWVAELGYTGTRGAHLPLVERNMNTVVPTETPHGWIYPQNGQVLNPNFASINTSDTWNADSNYEGLHASVRQNLGRRLQLQGSYAWSKSIDTASSAGSTNAISTYAGAMAVATPLFPSLNRGLSDFDIRHNFAFSTVWELPGSRTLPPAARWLVNGWQAGSILKAQTGTPLSVALNNDQAGSRADTTGAAVGQRPNLVTGSSCQSLTNPGVPAHYINTQCFSFPAVGVLGNLGRNTLTGPGILNLDFSLFKNMKLSEKMTSQFRVELFNAVNHTNFGTPNIVIFDKQGRVTANAGLITTTATDPRRIQFGLKLHF